MPELPEVETVKNGLLILIGATVKDIIIRHPHLRYPLNKRELGQALNQKITALTRRAKYLIMHLENGHLIFHLGMSGRLTLHTFQSPAIGKHDHVDIICDRFILRYNDQRRFGCILFVQDLTKCSVLANLGPEPLEDQFTAEHLYNKLQSRTTSIKQLIMDNTIVVGVGNIYACESLFLSKISPLKRGKDLSLAECKRLVKNIRQVLLEAIQAGGSSLRDYKTAAGELGYFQHCHNVYGRSKQECKTCGALILEIRLGQRNSFYCPNCQS